MKWGWFFVPFRRYHSALGLDGGQQHIGKQQQNTTTSHNNFTHSSNNNFRRSINQSFNTNIKVGAKNLALKIQDGGGGRAHKGKIQDGAMKKQNGDVKSSQSLLFPDFRHRNQDSELSGKISPSKSGIFKVLFMGTNIFRHLSLPTKTLLPYNIGYLYRYVAKMLFLVFDKTIVIKFSEKS